MRRSRKPIRIASRVSPLAQAQARQVGEALHRAHGVEIEYHGVESAGDQQADAALTDVGGKGLFARAVEQLVLDGTADLAVHSYKDLPSAGEQPRTGHRHRPSGGDPRARLTVAVVPRREDPRDCFIAHSAAGFDDLPDGATFGSASPRRAAMALRIRPDLNVQVLRGNVQTRLDKVLQDRQCDATLMAVAGLRRLGLAEHAGQVMDPHAILPAASQGALAVQCLIDDHRTIQRCLCLNHASTAEMVRVERQVIASVGGDCHSPIAAHAEALTFKAGLFCRLRACALSPDGGRVIQFDATAHVNALSTLVGAAIKSLYEQGAREVLSLSPATTAS